jgi:hypothetical protein
MNDLHAMSLMPFVPSGKDYEKGRQFFADLGFEEVWEYEGYAGFRNGNAQFILQRYNNKEFAENLMIAITVADLDKWWRVISQKRLEDIYPGFMIKPPTEFPWGREVHFLDLAGVCWHVRADVPMGKKAARQQLRESI